MKNEKTLYSKKEADFLSEREKEWTHHENEKIRMVLKHIDGCDSFLDVGCGSGLMLKAISKNVKKIVGIDENPERLRMTKLNCPTAEVYQMNIKNMNFENEFDVILTSQLIHEIEIFGSSKYMLVAMSNIKIALKINGKYLFLDHFDPGEQFILIKISDKFLSKFVEFKQKFKFRKVCLEPSGEYYRTTKRDIQDFITKTWALNSPMEKMEMNETHTIFSEKRAREIVKSAGFHVLSFIEFQSTEDDLKDHEIQLINSKPWNRKFLLVVQKLI